MTLNGLPVFLDFQDNTAHTVIQIPTLDRTVDLSIQGYCDQNTSQSASRQVLFFDIDPLDGATRVDLPSFTVLLDPSTQAETLVIPHPDPDSQCSTLSHQLDAGSGLFSTDDNNNNNYVPQAANEQSESPEHGPAEELRARFDEERKLIKRLTMDCRARLLDDLEKCNHDIKCSSKAICRHVREAVMNLMANLKSSLHQSPMVSDERQWQAIVADEKNLNYGTNSDSSTNPSPEKQKQNILILALEILAGVLGLAGLFACIRRHCHSFRRRAERLADREERKRAREYHRLARKEAIRKKWVAFKGVFTRFPCRKSACEEKDALIIEAAIFPTGEPVSHGDIEQAWNTLLSRHPDQIDTEVQRAQGGYLASLAESFNSKHGIARSRSSSLPSYESEKLPDYSSQPDRDFVVVEGYRVYSPSLTGTSVNTAITPDSSVPDLSPRCSAETLRTLMSRD